MWEGEKEEERGEEKAFEILNDRKQTEGWGRLVGDGLNVTVMRIEEGTCYDEHWLLDVSEITKFYSWNWYYIIA